jgi:hypothetical protein
MVFTIRMEYIRICMVFTAGKSREENTRFLCFYLIGEVHWVWFGNVGSDLFFRTRDIGAGKYNMVHICA